MLGCGMSLVLSCLTKRLELLLFEMQLLARCSFSRMSLSIVRACRRRLCTLSHSSCMWT